ncbi:Tetraspanin [Caenorhabditis elegans]|uniref:Tetraspanin n=1 Tax=Caenorhabditis elegans TaxID=6239 RepID=Q18177_CAEEL|nr:Tetraspanin [Caenorhabditis elegans]CCD65690.1 Tetraspanin [Caenorhabditis elegans]|eukprot:NP_508232.1 Tetraspanin [Caenorhabditis elegans]
MVCGNSCIKLLFFVINFFICIFGALICGFSLWANLDKNFGSHLSDFVRQIEGIDQKLVNEIAEYQASLWILVAVGALLFLVGFFGCCGAGCESPVLLGLFIFIIVILTAVELGATVFAMTNREEFVSSIQQVLKKSSATYELRKNIKPIQNVFQCCGATAQTQNRYIQDGLCGPEPLSAPVNCFDRISHMVQSWGESIVVVAFLLLAIELFAILFSCILCRSSQEIRYTPYYS